MFLFVYVSIYIYICDLFDSAVIYVLTSHVCLYIRKYIFRAVTLFTWLFQERTHDSLTLGENDLEMLIEKIRMKRD